MPRGISYYYADGQKIAMKDKDGVVSYLYGDQLGSVSAVADASGSLESRTLDEPWGEVRYTQGTRPTDYGYTGQMQEGDIYFYQSRWYDPQLGRFMQADTIVPLQVQGTQAFDRYAYVNNNPLRYTDPSGHCVGPLLVVCFMVGTWIVENAAVITAIAFTGAIVSYVGPSNPDPVLMNDAVAAQDAFNQANMNAIAWITLGEATLQFGQYYSFPPQQKQTNWPPNNGFEGEPQSVTLEPGTQFERIGNPNGYYASPPNTPFPQKSLLPERINDPVRTYEVLKPIPDVLTGPTLPWFGQPGGGIQHYFGERSIESLVKFKFIKQIK
jgi:RHS repeat-associated protein